MLRATWYNNIVQTIFNTPLVWLSRPVPADHATVLLKLEFFNPLSSIKDRIGRGFIPKNLGTSFFQPNARRSPMCACS